MTRDRGWRRLDAAALERLSQALDREGVVAAMLIGAAFETLHTDEVDVVMLNGAPPPLRHGAMREGRRLVERDRDERVRSSANRCFSYRSRICIDLGTQAAAEQCGRRLAQRSEGSGADSGAA